MSKEAIKLALEALEQIARITGARWALENSYAGHLEAITALREALAEQPAQDDPDLQDKDPELVEQPAQQEPVAWHGYDLDGMVEAFDRVIQAHYNSKQPFHSPVDSDAQMALRILRGFIPSMKRYTSPPAQRKPLTDEDCTRIYNEANGITIKNPPITTERIFKAMRAAHGIKENT